MHTDLRLWNYVYKGVVGALVAVGCVCIAAGGAVALYAGWVVYLLIEDPKRIALVSRLVDLSGKRLEAARGSIDGRAFSIEMGEPVFWLALLLIGVLLVAIVAAVAKTLISVGLELLRRHL
jgi:hypothetical protein